MLRLRLRLACLSSIKHKLTGMQVILRPASWQVGIPPLAVLANYGAPVSAASHNDEVAAMHDSRLGDMASNLGNTKTKK
jgi:hypothetical protein